MASRAGTPLAVLVVALSAPFAWAQGSFRFVPSVIVSECYDDNVFSTSEDPETDYVTRVTPRAEATYKATSFTANGRYAMEADYFQQHPSVSTVPSGQDVTLELGYVPSTRVLLAARGGYTETRSPSGLAPVLGLDLGRASARRLAGGGGLTWRASKRGRLTFGGDWDRDQVVGAEWGMTRTANASYSHRLTKHSEASILYTLRRFDFEAQPGLTAHVVALSWTRDLGRRSQITLSGGPRFEPDRTEPEGAAWLQVRPGLLDITLGASRVGSRVLGFPDKWRPGAATTESVSVEVGVWSPSRHLRIAVTPGLYHTRLDREDRDVTVRRIGVESAFRMKRWLALKASYEWSLQQGDLSSEPGDVRHRIFRLQFATNPSDNEGPPLVLKKPNRGEVAREEPGPDSGVGLEEGER